MTEAEILELLEIATTNAYMGFTLYLSVMFAYVVTAYFVGKNLSKIQGVLASGLFVFGAFTSTGATVIPLARGAGYINSAKALSDRTFEAPFWWAFEGSDFWVYLLLTTCSGGVILGLYFMWNVRQSKKE